VYDSRAAVYEKLGRPRDALRDAKKVIDLAPDRWQGYARSARLFLKSGKYDASLTMFYLALERVRPDDAKRRVELTMLKDEAHEAQRQTEEQRRRVTYHFGKLPIEIFGEIFGEVVSADCASVLVISHVCRHWRAIAWNTPALWTTLVLTGKDPIGKAKLWTKRSKGKIRELCARASLTDKFSWSFPLVPADWSYLRICRVHNWNISRYFQQISMAHILSNLEELEVVETSVPWTQNFTLSQGSAQLRSLTMDGARFQWDSLSPQVTNLAHLVVRDAVLLRGTTVLPTLEANPRLETLVLDFSHATFLYESRTEPLCLPHLTHLEVGGCMWLNDFFGIVSTPSLRKLRLSRAGTAVDDSLRRLMERGSTFLTELTIRSCVISPSVLVQFLRLTAPLETLELLHLSSTNAVLEALATPQSSLPVHNASGNCSNTSGAQPVHLCPSLAHLNVSHCPDVRTGPLVRLVKSRLRSVMAETCPVGGDGAEVRLSPPVAEIASLMVDGCPQVEPEVLPWLRDKVKVFSCVYMTRKAANWKR